MTDVAAEVVAATTLVPGRAEGRAIVLAEPLSFWGGFDAATGKIVDRWHPQAGVALSGRMLVMAAGRGSSSGSSVLAEAIRLGTGPAGILLLARDAILALGALVAFELYGRPCPMALISAADWPRLGRAVRLRIDAARSGTAIELLGEQDVEAGCGIGRA